jgi:hypothetical protein
MTTEKLDLIKELKELESKNIFVEHAFFALGSDEWGFSYRITYVPKEYRNAKRRVGHLIHIDSFAGAGSTYVGAWDTIEEALINGVNYAKEKIIQFV